ncbi:MAG TPA: glycosyltransferase family 4 protein [Calditrichia bacterium]|nr:glycosyltransferase family 4 protein [Calditrichota bacterium]HQU72929.1 glycosyltransferase family 4 protein [Calditrichia bacterium]HQV33510.1 glycosyltransferase family 4 protein [Calditrichia bacterium]
MKQRIKVAHIVNHVGPAGKEKGIIKLVDHQDDRIFDIHIVVLNHISYPDALKLERFKLNLLEIPPGNQILKTARYLSKIFREEDYHIIHTHSWGTLVEGVLGAKLAGSPVVIHGEHGSFPDGFPQRVMQNVVWRLADRILSVSGILADKLAETIGFPRGRMEVILNGVDETLFFPDPDLRKDFRERFDFAEDDFIIGAIGRLFPVKNYPMLFRAVRLMKDRGVRFKVAIVGGGVGDMEDVAKELIDELEIGDHIHMLGFQKEVNTMLNGFDVFTLTSFSEGCSNVIQEAMFAGRPVVATRVGGNPELVTHNETGFLVESDNHEQLADRFMDLLANPDMRRRFGEKGRERGLANFSLNKMVQLYSRAYLEEYRRKTGKPLPPGSEEILADKAIQPPSSRPEKILRD